MYVYTRCNKILFIISYIYAMYYNWSSWIYLKRDTPSHLLTFQIRAYSFPEFTASSRFIPGDDARARETCRRHGFNSDAHSRKKKDAASVKHRWTTECTRTSGTPGRRPCGIFPGKKDDVSWFLFACRRISFCQLKCTRWNSNAFTTLLLLSEARMDPNVQVSNGC